MFWYLHSKYDYLSDENSEYNSDSGDDLPNLTRDKQRVLRKYKYLNRSDCPRKECLYASENVQPEGWVIRQEFPHSYRYFDNLSEFEIWHESIPENQRTFHEVIRIGQPQKIKIDMDGELEKFASYPDPLDRIEKALGQKSFDGYIANTHLHTWQKSTDIMRKKDEISLYIKNALRIAIKEISGLNLLKNDIIIADSSNEMKWSKHLILPRYFVRGASKARKFTSQILELLPEKMHPFIDEKVNKDLHCFRLAGSHKAKDSSRIKRICSNHTWRESLITHIEKDSIELWPYEWEEDKKLKNESVSHEESDTAIKIVEKQFPFLSYRNSNNGFDIFDRIRPTTCSICEKEHTREGMYGRWRGSYYFLYCFRQKKGESGIEVVRADHNKKKVIPRLDRLRARLQHRSQSHSQNNFTAVGKNIEIYNAKTMHSYNLQAKLTSGNQHLMLIKGHCGVGKSNETAEEIRTLCHSDGSSVSTLIISGQRSLAHGQKVLFEGFKSYLELDAKKLNPKDTPKLIISPESIHKLGATGYDVIILDEFETITQNFSGSTMKKPKLSHDVYKSLLQSALLILALDATLDSDSLVHLQNISKLDAENSTVIWNQHIRDKRHALIHINTKKWNVELIGALRQGLKVYIPMFASVEMAEALHKELESQGYQGKCFSKRLLETEKKEIFADINNAVANLDYLIATPVMTCGVSITVENFDMTFAHFRTLAGPTSNEAYQMLHRVRKLNQNVVHILTDLRSDNLPTDREDLLRFISYRCNITEYPDLEEAHCDKILTPDGRWIFKPNASLETHLYNASRRNASRNDFVSLLTDRLSECGYNINIAEDCPSIDSKLTENNEGKELLLQIRSIKKTLDTEKYSMIANAQVLSDIEALDIRECLEREEDINPAYRLALQKYNLASFYKKTPEDITKDFVEKYSQKEMRNAYSALVQAVNPLDDLRENYRFMVIGDSREKASCDSLLPKVIALEEILRGIGFSSGIHTSYTLSRQDFDTNLPNFLPIYKKNERRYYAIFGKKWRPHANYNLKYFMEFLLKPLKEFKVSFYREKDRRNQLTHLKLKIDGNLKMILPDACLSDN
ncbi:6946_t:CDS:1, partial [Racocetra fulgida]